MPREIEISVDKSGKMRVEFVGFPEEECFEEAERLQAVLANMGLKVDVRDIVPKTSEQIRHELGVGEEGDQLEVRQSEP